MKKIILSAIAIALLATSCSKKENTTPETEQQPISEVVKITDSIKIGNQYWTTTNYNGNSGSIYGNASTPNTLWGKLYTFDEAKALTLPKGWRLPSISDFNKLLEQSGATLKGTDGNYISDNSVAYALMSKNGWLDNAPVNTSGFNAVPAGYYKDGFTEAGTAGATYVSALFATTSTYSSTAPVTTGPAVLFLYQYKQSTSGGGIAITTLGSNKNNKVSLRFVRDK